MDENQLPGLTTGQADNMEEHPLQGGPNAPNVSGISATKPSTLPSAVLPVSDESTSQAVQEPSVVVEGDGQPVLGSTAQTHRHAASAASAHATQPLPKPEVPVTIEAAATDEPVGHPLPESAQPPMAGNAPTQPQIFPAGGTPVSNQPIEGLESHATPGITPSGAQPLSPPGYTTTHLPRYTPPTGRKQETGGIISETPMGTTSRPGRSFRLTGPMIGGIVLGLFLLVGGVVFGFGVMVAYGKIELPDEQLTAAIRKAVFSIPFMPKNPEIVLAQMTQAHEKLTSASMTASLSTKSESLAEALGTNTFDMAISGDVDWSVEKKPKAQLNVKVTSQFDADIVVMEDKFYFKVNEIPQLITGFLMGMTEEGLSVEPLLNRWVWVDTSELETDAKELLEENAQEGEPADEEFERFLARLRDEVFMPKLEMNSDNLDGHDVYALSLQLEDTDWDAITRIYQEEVGSLGGPSTLDTDEIALKDVIKRANFTVYVDALTYNMRKLNMVMTVDSSPYASTMSDDAYGALPNLEPETMDIAFSMGMDNFGSIAPIVAPSESAPFEEYMAQVMRLFSQANFSEEELLQLQQQSMELDQQSLY